jgi:hypothetical protein
MREAILAGRFRELYENEASRLMATDLAVGAGLLSLASSESAANSDFRQLYLRRK